MDLKAFGQRIKSIREEVSLSQDGLARDSGVSRNTINDLEQGRGNPTLKTFQDLADTLDVPFGAWLGQRPKGGPLSFGAAIDFLARFEGLSAVRKAAVLSVIFDDEHFLEEFPQLARFLGSLPKK